MSTTTDRTQRISCSALPFVFVVFVINVPGGPARLLDHDEHLDDRAADDRARSALGPMRPPAPTAVSIGDREQDGGKGSERRRPTASDGERECGRASRPHRRAAGGLRRPRRADRRRRRPPRKKKKRSGRRADDRDAGRRPRARIARAHRRRARPRRRASRSSRTARRIRGALDGDDLGLFIGRHGQTIDAVQHLAPSRVAARAARTAGRVVVDAAGYRERRRRRSSARPTRPPTRRVRYGRASGARRDERDGAQGRARVPQGPRRTSRRTPRATSRTDTSSCRRRLTSRGLRVSRETLRPVSRETPTRRARLDATRSP